MNPRYARILYSIAGGSIGVAVGLYFGRFIAGGAAFPFRSSLQTIQLVTSTAWWATIGLTGGLGLAFTAIRRKRFRFVISSVLSFALGGICAALLVQAAAGDRASSLPGLAIPLAGALSGLLIGLAAGLKSRALTMLIVGALALAIAAPHIGAPFPPNDIPALIVPGALLGMALAVLSYDQMH